MPNNQPKNFSRPERIPSGTCTLCGERIASNVHVLGWPDAEIRMTIACNPPMCYPCLWTCLTVMPSEHEPAQL
jgi:hypothetical protein